MDAAAWKAKRGGVNMAQYCRYCSHFITGNGNYCRKKQIEPSDRYAKSTNHCKEFDLNPIDAYYENLKGYRPRKPREKSLLNGQMTVYDLLTEE